MHQSAVHLSSLPVADHSLGWEKAVSAARRRALDRTVQALFREGLLDRSQLIHEGPVAWLPLWRQQALLRLEGLRLGAANSCRVEGAIALYGAGRLPRLIATPAALLAVLGPGLGSSEADLARLNAELDNSVENDALCLRHRATWGQALRERIGTRGSVLDWLRGDDAPQDPALLLEQWGCLGHPWHPNYKTKLGLSTEDVVALAPEFAPELQVPVLALRREAARTQPAGDSSDYATWFAQHYPAAWQAWRAALAAQGLDAADWLPLPVHPFQAERVLPQRFAAELERGVLKRLPGVALAAAPTMSFRTLAPLGAAPAPHVKLPVSLRLTSVERTVSPKSAVMGPRITALLRRILADEAGFDGALDILGEEFGLHYLDPDQDDDRSRHLSVLFRQHPLSRRDAELFPVPVGALFADSPLDARPLVTELVARAEPGPGQPLAFYRRYLRVALQAVLGPYLLYGIAFEAHQQNSFILIGRDGQPRRLLLRDFGDLRLHRPTLAARGRDIEAYRAGHTAFDDVLPVRDKLLHAVFLCHFVELGLLLAREYELAEDAVWPLMREEVESAFERLRPHTDAQRWQAERAALLEADWPAKSFVRMRLCNTSDDLVGRMPNPLRRG